MGRTRRTGTIAAGFTMVLFAAACGSDTPDSEGGGGDAASDYPSEQITFVVPYEPGGSTDLFGRAYADRLAEVTGQTVVVENVGGGGGGIGQTQVIQSEPDGYTIGLGTNTALGFQQFINPDVPWETPEDYTALGTLAETPSLLVVSPDSPFEDFGQMIEEARERPGEITVGTTGARTLAHITMQQVMNAEDVEFNMVHLPSAGEALTAVIGGHVDTFATTLASAKGLITDGALEALVVLTDREYEALPDVPLISDYDLEPTITFGLYVIAPPGLPDDIAAALERLTREVLESEGYLEFQAESGAFSGPIGIEDTEQSLSDQTETLREIAESME